MRSRLLAATALAAASALSLATATSGLAAATTGSPATGSATGTLTLLQLQAAGGQASVLGASLQAVRGGTSTALADLVPATSGPTGAVGEQRLTSGSRTVGGGQVALPAGLGSLTGPAAALVVTPSTPSAALSAQAPASASVLGVPVALGAITVTDGAAATVTQASASTTVRIESIDLPSLGALLTALGLKLTALTGDQLVGLAGVLGSTVTGTAASTLASAQTALSAGSTSLVAAQAAQASAHSALDAASAALTSRLATIDALSGTQLATLLAALGLAALPTTIAELQALPSATIATLDTLTGSTFAAELTAYGAASAALSSASALVDQLAGLVAAVTGALDQHPLARLSGVVLQAAAVASTSPRASVRSEVAGLQVLGAGVPVGQLSGALAGVSSQLNAVLTSLGTGVQFTAPQLALGTASHQVSHTATLDTARAGLAAMRLTLPALSLPAALSSTGAARTTPAVTLAVGVLGEQSSYVPPVSAPPRSAPAAPSATSAGSTQRPSSGTLASTGADPWLALTALAALTGAGGLVRLRRRAAAQRRDVPSTG